MNLVLLYRQDFSNDLAEQIGFVVILMIAIIPVLIYQVRSFRSEEAAR